MDQHDRDSVISDFKQGNIRVMVATSVAARGLDVKALRLVVNYDCPNHYEDYVHRVGRTGRAGLKGTAYTFIQPDQPRYVIIRNRPKQELLVPDWLITSHLSCDLNNEFWLFEGWLLDSVACRYAGDLVNAMEASGARVPTDLELLWKDYVDEQKEMGLSVEKNKGFSGRGFKFTEEETMMFSEKKQLQKFQLGKI